MANYEMIPVKKKAVLYARVKESNLKYVEREASRMGASVSALVNYMLDCYRVANDCKKR